MSKETLEPRTARERALCRMAIKTLWDVNRTRAITDMFVIGAPSPTPEEIANKLFPEPAPRLREITFERMGWRFTVTFADKHFHLKRTLLANSATTGTEKHVCAASVAADVMMPDDATLRALLDLPNNPTLPPEPEDAEVEVDAQDQIDAARYRYWRDFVHVRPQTVVLSKALTPQQIDEALDKLRGTRA